MTPPPALVVTDLDGTLLDHDTYDWRPAQPALASLRQKGIPVILASSKTAPELLALHREMDLGDAPVICENGAGLVHPGDGMPDGAEYRRLRAVLADVPDSLRASFTGFGDLGARGIVAATGLPPEAAKLAATRAFSEPGVWTGDAAGQKAFEAHLAHHGVTARSGGRFLTLSFGATKADRLDDVARRYGHPPVVALGDAPNDVEMLTAAAVAGIIRNPHGPGIPPLAGEATGRIRRSKNPGPAGWNEMIPVLLSALGIEN